MSWVGDVENVIMRRLSLVLVLVGVAAAVLLAPVASATDYDTGGEAVFIDGVNQARSQAGVGAIRVSSDLVAIARRHSAEMAAKGQLYHNANLGNEVTGWQAIAENVGDGTSAPYVNNLFLQSAPHHKNMVDPRWVDMGIGVVWSGDHLYVTEVFRQPEAAAAPAPAPAPAPAATAPAPRPPAPKQAPAPRPAPAPAPVAAPAPPPAPAPVAPPTTLALRVISPTGVEDVSSPVVLRTTLAAHVVRPEPLRGVPTPLVAGAVVLQLSIGILAVRDIVARSLRSRRRSALTPSIAQLM